MLRDAGPTCCLGVHARFRPEAAVGSRHLEGKHCLAANWCAGAELPKEPPPVLHNGLSAHLELNARA